LIEFCTVRPGRSLGGENFQIDFDFVDHTLKLQTSKKSRPSPSARGQSPVPQRSRQLTRCRSVEWPTDFPTVGVSVSVAMVVID
jgi:hypothetical protein